MKAIIFINTNKSGSSREAVRAAEQLGYFTILFTNNEKQLQQREEYSEVHKMVLMDVYDLPNIRNEIYKLQAQGIEIETIVSFIDPLVYTASLLCDEFCHNNTSSEAIEKMEDKDKTRSLLKNQPYSPIFFSVKPDEMITSHALYEQLDFPVIIKSAKSTGSKDVILAEGKGQLEKYFKNFRNKNPDDVILIEEYIDGPQYLVEVLVHNNKAHIVAIVEQEITKGKRFIITGYGVLAEAPKKMKTEIEKVLQSIIKAFGMDNGAMHLELRLSKNGWKLIEINPRISGGAMNKMIQAAFGFSLVEETLKLFVGQTPNLVPKYKKYVFTKYIIVSKKGRLIKVTGKGRAANAPGVVEVYVKPKKGTLLIPPLSMGHRYAYIIATGDNLGEAKSNANIAAKEIKFLLDEE
ncbi:ATP-grasp domain-containing protein [Bacillus sp. FJAT-22090]|uniref:ATP-grasp domain-containing protein n=1 Tax=Bacillus sp. FJAT-22090 TaxID=1581038 RepID=UPI0016434908|nr:ATP-grasp domain-containing protein [Bacillus sp. FJAT-22090]